MCVGCRLKGCGEATPAGRQPFIVRPRASHVTSTIHYGPINTGSLLFVLMLAPKAERKRKTKENKTWSHGESNPQSPGCQLALVRNHTVAPWCRNECTIANRFPSSGSPGPCVFGWLVLFQS
jgi:hypothetical protein